MSRVTTVNYKDVALRLLLDSATLWSLTAKTILVNRFSVIFYVSNCHCA